MDFFRNQWNPINQPSRPRYPATARGVPVRPVPPRNAPTTKPAPSPTASPKVVHIPVHFVGSEQKRSTSAVKIQKVFRGHLVRKSVKKVASIRRDVEEVEKAISRREIVDSIRRDPKERMRLNETLMSLLFKLDSVRGVDSGVRDFRKAVIKKAIALQERVDDIASGNETVTVVEEDRSESDVVETLEIDEQTPEIDASQIGEKKENEEPAVEETLEIEDQNPQIDSNQGGPVVEEEPVVREEMLLNKDGGEEDMELANSGEDEDDAISCSNNNSEKKCEEEEEEGSGAPEKMDISEYVMVDDKVEDDKKMDTRVDPPIEVMEESVDTSHAVMNDPECIDEVEKQGDNKTTEVMLEKMMEENQKMMSMMKQLFESNEMQTRTINSLSQRVGQLEKAFVCDRLRRKKRQGGGGGDGSGSSPDQKKFGKR